MKFLFLKAHFKTSVLEQNNKYKRDTNLATYIDGINYQIIKVIRLKEKPRFRFLFTARYFINLGNFHKFYSKRSSISELS